MFRVVATRDLWTEDGPFFAAAWYEELVGHGDIVVSFMDEYTAQIRAEQLEGFDAAVVWKPKVPSTALPPSLRLIARWGVGLDGVDVDACTRNRTLISITPDGVTRAVATANVALMLALDADLVAKDGLVRTGRWAERLARMGTGFTGKTLGSIGFGHIAQDVFRLLRPFDMTFQAFTPRPTKVAAAAHDLGVALVDLDTLLATSDIVCIHCPLDQSTRGMVGARQLARMKPSALLVNTARGAIVDEEALAAALTRGELRGAGLDVFGTEPLPRDHPLLRAPNVIVSPHATAWSQEMAERTAASMLRSLLAVKAGRVPEHCVNPEALAGEEGSR